MSDLPFRMTAMSRTTQPSSGVPTPFLRWAGGKRRLSEVLLQAFPKDFKGTESNFFEPFVGGGALMIKLGDPSSEYFVDGEHLYINDINPDLIITYKAIQKNVRKLMEEIDSFAIRKDKKEFLEVRNWRPKLAIEKAARFIYLNKTCFNGLWRVNSKGEFNVPYGQLKNPLIYDRDNLLLMSKRLRNATITNLPFAQAVEPAKKGDLVYFDPPYIPLTTTASFAQYAKDGFGMMDQFALAGVIEGLTAKGVNVILSNSETDATREVFGNILTLRQISAPRSISATVGGRGNVKEVIGTNFKVRSRSELSNLRVVS
jgi:DNA adenine methylase